MAILLQISSLIGGKIFIDGFRKALAAPQIQPKARRLDDIGGR
jgi:hypothetical protein